MSLDLYRWIKSQVYDRQFGGMAGICTTDVLVEMLHEWYEATDVKGNVLVEMLHEWCEATDVKGNVVWSKCSTSGVKPLT